MSDRGEPLQSAAKELADDGAPGLAHPVHFGALGRAVRQRLLDPQQRGTRQADLVVMANEISFAHGTGVLMSRILEEAPPYVLFRAFDHWGGNQVVEPLADFVLHRFSQTHQTVAQFIASRISSFDVRFILTIAYTREDVIMAIAAKALTGAPMAIWIMDDNCLLNDGIPKQLMQDLVSLADARFVISDAMREVYESHYGLPFWVLPPLVARRFIRSEPSLPPERAAPQGCIVGNIWHQAWLEDTVGAFTGLGILIEWYTSSDDLHFLKFTEQGLAKAGIRIVSGLTHDEIARRVVQASFVLTPSFSGTETDGHAAAIGRLSLPSKMPFVTASAGVPFLVLANASSGAADYVRRFDLGEVVRYDSTAAREAVARLSKREAQQAVRQRSAAIAESLDVSGLYGFLVEAAMGRSLPEDRIEVVFSSAPIAARRNSSDRLL